MKNPDPINKLTTSDVRARGWIAEARDSDGHLVSTQRWLSKGHVNDNLRMLGEFIADYQDDFTVTVFEDMLLNKLTARVKA